MREEKNIPFRNYFILAIVLIMSISVVIYFYMWYSEIENSKLYSPIMDKYLNVINYNELDNYLVENKNVVIYVSVLEDEDTRKFERKFKKIINNYSLGGSLLYLNLTSESMDKDLYDNIKNKYELSNLPCVMFFMNGVVYDNYSIQDNNYDVDLLISYLKIKGVIDD